MASVSSPDPDKVV